MSVSLETIDKIINYIERNEGISAKKITSSMKLNEKELNSILALLLQYKFINDSDHYNLTNVGREYLNIKS